jgi:hypothetical protein
MGKICDFLTSYKGTGVVRVVKRYGEVGAKRILSQAFLRYR